MNECSAEIFDVVNDNDQVIGQKPRSEVHRLGLKHRAVHILIFNSRGQIFLQKRSQSKDTFPGVWDSSASGHLDTGETYDVSAMREVAEELGIVLPAIPTFLFKITACKETGWEFVNVYKTIHEGPFRLHPQEIERGDWFTPSQVSRWIQEKPSDFASGFMFIWQHLPADFIVR
jgi:isopentenyl-diphosphate delta-isomerase type 1